MTPKYLYSKGLKKSRVLFGQYLITEKTPFVCITEGTLDTMWLDQHGFPSVAILGASLSKAQEELTLGLQTEELVLCLDNDEAGQIGFQKAMGCLSKSFVVSYVKLPKEFKDVQDVRNSEELASIIKNRTFF
jgi:DNA primase